MLRSYNQSMVPLESSTLFDVLASFTDAIKMKETTINNQDSSGDTCSISDPTAASTTYCPVKDNRSVVEDKDKSWLRLGIGSEYQDNTASYKLQRCCSQNESRREKSLDLSLFSSSSAVAGAVSSSLDYSDPQPQPQPIYSHDQLLRMHGPSLVYSHQLNRPQALLNRGFPYTAPFRPSSLSDRDVTSGSVEEPSSEIRVLDPPTRPRSGLWFLLQASQFQEKEPFLPQVNKSYLRIKDGRITVRLLIKYLMKKLQLDNESEIEIRCRGQQLSPLLTMQHVRDSIWTPKSSSSSFTLLRDSSTADHVMILHYGRIA